MGTWKFEINLISASDLEDVREFGVMKVASIAGNKLTEKRTRVDYGSGTNPAWNFTTKYNIGKKVVQEEGVILVIKLFCMRTLLAELYVGEVHASTKQLYEQAMTNGGGTTLTCKVQKGGVESAGEFKLSCHFGEAIVSELSFWRRSLAKGGYAPFL